MGAAISHWLTPSQQRLWILSVATSIFAVGFFPVIASPVPGQDMYKWGNVILYILFTAASSFFYYRMFAL